MTNLSSGTDLSYLSCPGQGRQIEERADRNAFISSWRQNVAEESSHIRHVAEFFDAGQRGYQSDAVGTTEVSLLSLLYELRALPTVTSMSSLNVRRLDGGSAHRNLVLPVPIDTTMPRAELSIALPSAVAFPSPIGIHHASVNVASAPRVPNTNPDSARVVVSASSQPPCQPSPSPGTHPTLAVFLEAALVKRARALTTGTNDTNATSSPPPSAQHSSITPSSSRAPAYPGAPADCGHPQCIRATESIRDISCLQQGRLTHDLYRAAVAAHQVVVDCTRARIITAFRECLVLLHGMGSARNQGFHVPFYDACRSTGFDPATLPALTGVPLPPNWPHWQARQRLGVVCHAAGGDVYA